MRISRLLPSPCGAVQLLDSISQYLRTLGELLKRSPVLVAHQDRLRVNIFYLLLESAKELGRWDVQECLSPDAGLAAVYGPEPISWRGSPFE